MKHVKLVATSVIACAAIMAVPGGALAAKHGPQAHATGKAGTANIVRVSGTLTRRPNAAFDGYRAFVHASGHFVEEL